MAGSLAIAMGGSLLTAPLRAVRWGQSVCTGPMPVSFFTFIAILFTSGLDVGLIMFPLVDFELYATEVEYGFANPLAPNGNSSLGRGYSRVLEINPVTLEMVWSYRMSGQEAFRFYSAYISAAQLLEDGNTMITLGAYVRLVELTTDGDSVGEYVRP